MKQPPTVKRPEISYAEIVLLGESEPESPELVEDFSYQKVYNLHTNSSHHFSPLPATVTHTPSNTSTYEEELMTSPSMEIASKSEYSHQIEALSLCPSIYSSILLSQPLQTLPPSSTTGIHDIMFQFGGETELLVPLKDLDSPPSQMEEQETCCLSVAGRKHGENPVIPPLHFLPHSPFSFSNFSHSSVLSHSAELTSPHPSFPPSYSKSPFLHNVSVDFSYCKYSVGCDPYISPAV